MQNRRDSRLRCSLLLALCRRNAIEELDPAFFEPLDDHVFRREFLELASAHRVTGLTLSVVVRALALRGQTGGGNHGSGPLQQRDRRLVPALHRHYGRRRTRAPASHAARQAERCFEIVGEALERAGSGWHDVVRTRLILTNIDDWKKVIDVRKKYCVAAKPVDTIMQVTRFVNPEWLVEIEVDAVVADD